MDFHSYSISVFISLCVWTNHCEMLVWKVLFHWIWFEWIWNAYNIMNDLRFNDIIICEQCHALFFFALVCFGLFILCRLCHGKPTKYEWAKACNKYTSIGEINNELCIVCHCVCSFSPFFFLFHFSFSMLQCSTLLFKFDFFSLSKSNIIIFHMDYSFFYLLFRFHSPFRAKQ